METIYRSIPVWLRVGRGADHITYSDRNGQPARASWSPGNGTDTFGVSIGGPDSPVRGTLVGERYSRQILQACISQGLLPLPTNYTVTDRDDDLMKLVEVGSLPAWDALVVPVATVAGILGVDTGATGPHREPGGGARPADPAPPASPAAPAAPAAPAPTPAPAPLADQTLRQALEARFPGKGSAYANALNDLDSLGAHPDPGRLIADLLPLFGGSLGAYGPMIAMVLTMALSSGKSGT